MTAIYYPDLSPSVFTPRINDIDANKSALVSSSPTKIYEEISVIRHLNKAKFPVYLVCSKVNQKVFAMKAFPYENGHRHPYYQNELRFAPLQHQNIVKSLYFQGSRKTRSKGIVSKISYKVMEFAPYGDFFEFITKFGQHINEKTIRTYFKQLIEGLEYLHLHGVSHLDLKLENLLLGENYTLKIADFDLSYIEGDAQIISRGTKYYRAPELIQGRCRNTNAADIYSAGILLFIMNTGGTLPHAENNAVAGVNFADLLHHNELQFWIQHCKVQKKEWTHFQKDFKELFIQMTQFDPEKRPTIQMIKKSRWYNGPCYTPEELKVRIDKLLSC